jgi:hypothetical protein
MGKVNVCVLECGHQFHTTCIIKCKNNKCPLCRDLILKEEENNYEEDEALVDFMIGTVNLLKSLGETHLNDTFIKQFLIKLDEKNYVCAYRIRCIYYNATMLLFRILGYSYELDYTLSSISGDIVKQMDDLIGDKIRTSEKRNIEYRVIYSMPKEEYYRKYGYFTHEDWMSHPQFGYVVLSELVKKRS